MQKDANHQNQMHSNAKSCKIQMTLSFAKTAKTTSLTGARCTVCNYLLVGGFNSSEKYESQLGWLFPIYGKIKNVPNHQPDSMYLIYYLSLAVGSGSWWHHHCELAPIWHLDAQGLPSWNPCRNGDAQQDLLLTLGHCDGKLQSETSVQYKQQTHRNTMKYPTWPSI